MSKSSKKGSAKARNGAARLLAVQAVYQMFGNDQSEEEVIKEFLEHRAGQDIEGEGDEMVTPDEDHFVKVVRGVSENTPQLVDMIAQNRGKEAEQKTAKKEPLLQSILLCASFELMALQAIDSPIIISDYLHVTRAFFDDGEVKLVNGLLNSLEKTVRN